MRQPLSDSATIKTNNAAAATKEAIATHHTSTAHMLRTSSGKEVVLKHTKFYEHLISALFKEAIYELFGEFTPPKSKLPLALYALGSFGREQLGLFSDIDIMFVYEEVEGFRIKRVIETILYKAWDLNIKFAHRVHKIDELEEVAKSDITIKSALLEARFIEGSFILNTHVQNQLSSIKRSETDSFIQSKLLERDLRHKRYPLSMQPNIKEGIGGLRDMHLLFWIARLYYDIRHLHELPSDIVKEDEYKEFGTAIDFLYRAREAFHIATNKKEDTLRLENIPRISTLLGYKKSAAAQVKFARDLIRSLKCISLFCSIWLERLLQAKAPEFTQKNALDLEAHNPYELLEKLAEASTHDFAPSPLLLARIGDYVRSLKKIDSHKVAPIILKAFEKEQSHRFFQTLLEARSLGKTMPILKHIIDLPQFDGYHRYSVDIHSIKCLYHLENIKDPFIKKLYCGLSKKEKVLLKVATFLHDAGKGRSKDHHSVGVVLFRAFAKIAGLNETLIKMGEKLVRHHTLMSNVAQREDIFNERILYRFVSYFPSKKLLDMITILTYADLSGVAKGIYSAHTAYLLKTLYTNALEKLDNTAHISEAKKRAKKEQRLAKLERFQELPKSKQSKIGQTRSTTLFLHHSAEEILDIALKAFEATPYTYSIDNDDHLVLEVIRDKDRSFNVAYLLSKLERFELKQMDIYKLFDEKKYFKMHFDTKANRADIDDIVRIIEHAFKKEAHFSPKKLEIKQEEITIECDYSESMASMMLRCNDQKGLLANIIALFDTLGIDIASAKIHTLKRKVRDLFLIEKNGNFCHNTELIIQKLTQKSR